MRFYLLLQHFLVKPSEEDESENTDVTLMQCYYSKDEPAPSKYFWSLIEKFSGSNGSVTHNENASSHFPSLLSSPPESPKLPQENTSSEPEGTEKSEQSKSCNQPQKLTVKPTDYAKLHNP